MFSNTSGSYNLATGNLALHFNRTGNENIASGVRALYLNTSGYNNTAIGKGALESNISGYENIAIGFLSNVSASNLHNAIAIGANTTVNGSNKIRMGNSDISVAEVLVAWTITSDKRWKENVKPMPLGLDFINDLNPVSYHRINNSDKQEEFGLIAQELEETLHKYGFSESDLGLLNKDSEGYYTIRYNDLIPTLIKAMQEQQKVIEKQEKTLEGYQKMMESLQKNNEKLSASIEAIKEQFLK